MQQRIIKALEEELKIAHKKEDIAKEENDGVKVGEAPYRIAVKFSNFTNAQGYVNGILEALDIARRIK